MKDIKVIILFVFLSVNIVLSQGLTDQGKISLTGSIAMSYTSSKQDSKNYSVLINPAVSYFLSKNFEAGLLFNYQYNENGNLNSKRIDRIWGLGPSLNIYLGDTESKPFLGISYVFSESNIHTNYNFDAMSGIKIGMSNRNYSKLHSFNINLGYLIKIHNDIALSPILQYQFSGNKFSNLGDQKTLFIGLQLKTFLF